MKALVTGGGGFLGRAIIHQLLDRGSVVRSFARGAYPDLAGLGVEVIQGDLAEASDVERAVAGCDLVFHVAAKAGIWGPAGEFHRTNIQGTANIIQACQSRGITRLIYTSSPSVVFAGRNQEGVDESVSYPRSFLAEYPKTKAQAEQMVLKANGPNLATVALRPHLIWGPGDPHFLPRLNARAKAGRLVKVRGGPYLVDTVYIDNAAEAHLLAAERLAPGSPIAGRIYFITQGEPIDMGELLNRLIATAGLPPIRRSVSPWVLYTAGLIFEALYTGFRVKKEPPMTRFLARQLATAHWFDISAAKRDLCYQPRISMVEGLRRLRAS